jgi:hypothetical protein
MVVAVFAFIGGLLQALSYGSLVCFYIGRFVEGLGLGKSLPLEMVKGSHSYEQKSQDYI